MKSCEVVLEVPFHDVDAMGIVWHGHYAKYFEIARCALLESIDYNYHQMKASGYSWPVVDMHVRYVKSATFRQKIIVVATLVEWENRLKVGYLIKDAADGRRLITGSTTQVAVDMRAEELCFVSPAVLFEKLGLPVP
jgi:acyl-CoA thioester hydrolase